MPISQGYCRRTTPDRCSPVRTVELVPVERVMSAVWETTHLADEAAAPKDAPEADFVRTHTRQSGVRWVKIGASRDQLNASTGRGQIRATTDELTESSNDRFWQAVRAGF